MLSKLAAKDGFSIHAIVNSDVLKELFFLKGFKLPKSQTTVIEKINEYGLKIKSKVVKTLAEKKASQTKFSITMDECSSVQHKRCANINVHNNLSNVLFNLGLLRVNGYFDATKCQELLENKAAEYGLRINEDVICVTSDGASVMKKFGRTMLIHKLCYAHGLHLAVSDVLYKTCQSTTTVNIPITEESDHEEEYNSPLETVVYGNEENIEITPYFKVLLQKLRRIVKVFKRSPLKSDSLRRYTIEEFGKELLPILYITEYNSLGSITI